MNITVATSIKYGNYKRYRPAADRVVSALKALEPILKKVFDYRHDVLVRVRPIRGSVNGRANNSGNWIEIDPRKTMDSIIETIAHEFTHSEQYKQGRLSWDRDVGEQVWAGVHYRRATTHKRYLNQPWEIEARERASEFMKRVDVQDILNTYVY